MARLKGWVTSNVNVRDHLMKPSCFEEMDDIDRKKAELDDRTQVASKLVDLHLQKNEEFTEIMGELSDVRGQGGKAIFCSAIREVLHEIQRRDWLQHANRSNARSRQAVSA